MAATRTQIHLTRDQRDAPDERAERGRVLMTRIRRHFAGIGGLEIAAEN